MKSYRFLMMTILVIISATLFAQTTTEKIKVYGNCSVCKKHIENASKLSGATGADWNKKTKWLIVTYDPAKTSSEQIQKNVAAAGYDTEKFKGDDKAYDELDPCCQYNRKAIAKKNK